MISLVLSLIYIIKFNKNHKSVTIISVGALLIEKLMSGLVVTSLTFGNNGELFAATANSPTLLQINVSNKERKEIKLPTLDKDDAISYISQNPTDHIEFVLVTYKKDVFISKDAGTKWTEIADKGNGISK